MRPLLPRKTIVNNIEMNEEKQTEANLKISL